MTTRVLQGFTSMGEVIGVQLYLSETLKQPGRYIWNAFIDIQVELGALFALLIAHLSTSFGFNWRIAFIFGTVIALVGLVARTRLGRLQSSLIIDAGSRQRKKLLVILIPRIHTLTKK